jgi:hypothetical protein
LRFSDRFGLEGSELGLNILLIVRRARYANRHIHTKAHRFVELPRIGIGISQRIERALHGVVLKRWVR